MSSRNNVLVTVGVGDISKFALPFPIGGDETSRASAIFNVATIDQGLSVYGTYDQILDFAADLMAKVMSYPIIKELPDWFDSDDIAVMERIGEHVGQATRQGDGPGGIGESGGQEGGSAGRPAPDDKV